MYKVVEIFRSIEGEGKRAGLPCTFIRLYGCNLECSYCDSRYACEDGNYTEMDFEDIVGELEELYERRGLVTITGGEPLLDFPGTMSLAGNLCNLGYEVNIETNGSVRLCHGAFNKPRNMFYTMDLKTPSSRMVNGMQFANLAELDQDDVLKIVVGNENDMLWAQSILLEHPTMAQVFVSPVWGKMNLPQMAELAKKFGWRVQVQLHKVIWGADKKGV